MMGGAIVPLAPVVCIAPVKYRGEEAVKRDIDNVKAGAKAAGVPDRQVFLPATSPSGVGVNEYYKSDEDYFHTVAAELGNLIFEPILLLFPVEGTLAASGHPLLYVLLAGMMLLSVLGSWIALQIVNRWR